MTTLNRLNAIISKPTRFIATVIAAHNNDTCTVRHSDNSTSLVFGNAPINQQVYINDGRITGNAANLTFVEIEV